MKDLENRCCPGALVRAARLVWWQLAPFCTPQRAPVRASNAVNATFRIGAHAKNDAIILAALAMQYLLLLQHNLIPHYF